MSTYAYPADPAFINFVTAVFLVGVALLGIVLIVAVLYPILRSLLDPIRNDETSLVAAVL